MKKHFDLNILKYDVLKQIPHDKINCRFVSFYYPKFKKDENDKWVFSHIDEAEGLLLEDRIYVSSKKYKQLSICKIFKRYNNIPKWANGDLALIYKEIKNIIE